jgi:hypothetical protein
MTVISPRASVAAKLSENWGVNAGYSADIVSGASEVIKAGPLLSAQPDIVSQASVTDQRHVINGGISATHEHTKVDLGYSYGFENDYRSNAISVSALTDFFQRNTQLGIAYSHAFDKVCDLNQPGLATTLRSALDSSDGCFSKSTRVTSDDIALDNVQVSWTQSWTPVMLTQLAFTGALQHGFLGNPYREVVLGPTGQSAQENHPHDRARGAMALRFKYYFKGPQTMVGGQVRGYGDSWDILSQSYELEIERYMLPWLRLRVHGRYYSQTGASFWSDDYTGGEPRFGARGQYWSGDRELSPLRTVMLGGRLLGSWHSQTGERLAGMMTTFSAGISLDITKTFLDDFTWAGRDPNDTLAFIPAVNFSGVF